MPIDSTYHTSLRGHFVVKQMLAIALMLLLSACTLKGKGLNRLLTDENIQNDLVQALAELPPEQRPAAARLLASLGTEAMTASHFGDAQKEDEFEHALSDFSTLGSLLDWHSRRQHQKLRDEMAHQLKGVDALSLHDIYLSVMPGAGQQAWVLNVNGKLRNDNGQAISMLRTASFATTISAPDQPPLICNVRIPPGQMTLGTDLAPASNIEFINLRCADGQHTPLLSRDQVLQLITGPVKISYEWRSIDFVLSEQSASGSTTNQRSSEVEYSADAIQKKLQNINDLKQDRISIGFDQPKAKT